MSSKQLILDSLYVAIEELSVLEMGEDAEAIVTEMEDLVLRIRDLAFPATEEDEDEFEDDEFDDEDLEDEEEDLDDDEDDDDFDDD